MWTFFTNDTCRPTKNPRDTCTLGFYGVYVMVAKEPGHVKAGIDFARTHNLRLTIRNTGHDWFGRSTGWGALVINTHTFQNISIIDDYSGPGNYTGAAVTIGAGVQGRELLRQINKHQPPLSVAVGECPTVGPSGGYVQGGGHGPLTTLYGLAADNVLAFEVLTSDGEYKVANTETNSDLFWALAGGGPGAYAVILSTTYRAQVDLPSAGAIIDINSTHTTNETLWWEAVRTFHNYSNHFVDNGLYAYYGMGLMSLHVQPFVAINQSAEQLNAVLKPLFEDLDRIGLKNYSSTTREYDTFFDLYIDLFEDESAGGSGLAGGWVFAHDDITQNNERIVNAFYNILSNSGYITGHFWYPGYGVPTPRTSTNPRFRNASDFVVFAIPVPTNATLDERSSAQYFLTENLDKTLRAAGPNGCGYVNEGDPHQPDWQTSFYGTSYAELVSIKRKWDPNGLFYTIATPGAENWEVIEEGTRLCKRSEG